MAKAPSRRPMIPMPLWMGVSCGIAVALIVMMLPLGMLETFVEQTGLASVLPAAAPPLGQTARGLLAAAFGLVMAVSCFVLLRALEGLPPIRIRMPRVKRRQDAAIFGDSLPEEPVEPVRDEEPRRGPIMAARDLGAPFHSITAASIEARTEPEPALLLEPAMMQPPSRDEEMPAEEDPPAPAIARHEDTRPEELEPEALEPEARPLGAVTVEGAVETQPVEDPPAEDPEPSDDGVVDQAPMDGDAAPIPVSPRAAIEGSIPALVRRLETGFERRLAGREPQPQAEPGFADPQSDIDLALRDALGTLQRMSARSR